MAIVNNWYGSIPDSWTVVSFNQSVKRMATGLNPRENFVLSKTDEFYYVTIRNFKDNQLFLDDNCDRISKQAWEIIQARSDLRKGDIIFASISKDGQAYLLDSEPDNWNINESVFCIRVDEKLFNNRYFRYEITNIGFYNDLLLDATGTTFKSIKQNKLRQSKLIAPPLTEQQAIASYLDDRCSKLDEIITEAEKSIEEYKELKQAVIFEAVTKGLNKNVPMKDSGVEWIGKMPFSWTATRIKYLLTEVNNRSETGEEESLSVSQVLGVVPSSMISVANPASSTIGQKIVEPGDLVFNKLKAHLGVFFVSNYRGLVSPDYAVYRANERVNPKFLEYLFHTPACITEFKKYITGVAVGLMRLYTSSLYNIYVALPERVEQEHIIEYLNNTVHMYDALISEKQALINDLQAYKKSLIYEVVTGKRRVV